MNQDKPYNRFVQEQIAGDEMWPDDPKARVATAFSRHYPDEWNARDLMQRRQEILQDITDAVGSAFLGLTFGCAKCHDHKFDPILQRDYYRLQAFFAHTANDDAIPMWSNAQREEEQKQVRGVGASNAGDSRRDGGPSVNGARSELDRRTSSSSSPNRSRLPSPRMPTSGRRIELQMAARPRVISHPSISSCRCRG